MADFVVESGTFTKYVLKVVLFKSDRISRHYKLCVSV